MNVTVRFALDRNHDRVIQPEEVLKNLGDLGGKDEDGNGVLKGRELEDVYFEVSRDSWLEAGRPQRRDLDGFSCTWELRSLALTTGQIDLSVKCHPA